MNPLDTRLAGFRPRVDEFVTRYRPLAEEITRKGEELLKAAEKVGEAHSGSWFGYHSELYYQDFAKPPLQNRFNVEWGGVNGLPPGWRQRDSADVLARIQSVAGYTFDELEKKTSDLADACRKLQSDLTTELSTIQKLPQLEAENALLKQIETLEWTDKPRNEYATAAARSAPNASRDSSAVFEGTKLPPHAFYEAEAYKAKRHAEFATQLMNFAAKLLRQLELQPQHGAAEAVQSTPVDKILFLFSRFSVVAKQLAHRRQGRPTLIISDEYDVQDLLHSLLRLYIDDVRPEEPTPSTGGGGSRMDFLLKREQIVVEAKMTRAGLKDREVYDELMQDVARYREHPDCKTLLCLIYDPAGLLKNPRGLESDIQKLSTTTLQVKAVVIP